MAAVTILVVAACLTSFHSTLSADLFSEYAHHAVLDAEAKMKLFWTIDWDGETVSFAVEAETTGWVGIGFSTRSGQMIGSDVVIGWVKDNKGYLTDRYADAESIPPMDESQDYELTGFQESGGKTLLKFKRKFDTCDPRDRKLEVGATKVVFAFHNEDPVSSNNLKQHVFRGTKAVLLMNKMDRREFDDAGLVEYIMTIGNVTIPPSETTYWCSLLKGPELNSKHHITRIEPYIQKGNEGFVHHYLIYECEGNFTDDDLDKGADCYSSANMPYRHCQKADLIAGWAVGGEAINLPPHVGFPIGGEGSPKYFLIEMHYDNPGGIAGRIDSSGARIFYTNKLRKYEAGVLSVGVAVNSWHLVPPKQSNWISTGYCMHQCTEAVLKSTSLPEGGINVITSTLHSHLAARATWTKHIRKGKELPDIARDNNYDFNFQDSQFLRKEINIQPGDDIVHSCKYNSEDRDKAIQGGLSTREEMCINFIIYYPRIKGFTLCESTLFQPSVKLLEKYLPVNVTDLRRNPLAYTNVDWTDAMVADLRKYETGIKKVIPSCWQDNVKSVNDLNNADLFVPVPQITDPLPRTPRCSTVSSTGFCCRAHAVFILFFVLLCSMIGPSD